MSGLTARGEAKEIPTSTVFDYEKGSLGLFELMDAKETLRTYSVRKPTLLRVTACRRPCGSRSKKPPYACPSGCMLLVPRPTDIIEAIVRIHIVSVDVPLDAFETDRHDSGW